MNSNTNFQIEDSKSYQFLFDLSNDDKQLLANYAQLDSINAWENKVKQLVSASLPSDELFDMIHFTRIVEKQGEKVTFQPIDAKRFREISFANYLQYNDMNDVEINALALVESLRQG
ncbi:MULTISPECIES: hypothetical protein [unclassified Acinetobacter]|uniref:hypothetical protein n=1 Tax=unclassified Acinetobacter TaxID=196816 RepID=UPI0035B87087